MTAGGELGRVRPGRLELLVYFVRVAHLRDATIPGLVILQVMGNLEVGGHGGRITFSSFFFFSKPPTPASFSG